MRRRATVLGFTLTIALLIAVPSPALATYTGTNGKIAFSTDLGMDPQIFSVNPDGTAETQLTFDATGHSVTPDWSPDGTRIVFSGDETGDQQIYVMNANGTGRHQLTSDPGFDHLNPKFSPDGTKIAFGGCPTKGTCAIYVMSSDGTDETPLTSLIWNSADPEFSPDGTKIAFDSNQDGFVSAVWVMNANGTNQTRLTNPLLEAFFPDWSPDGSRIVFTDTCCAAFGLNVWTMRPDGSKATKITHFHDGQHHQGGFARYSPDGQKFVLWTDLKYKDNCCQDVYTMDTNGNHKVRVTSNQPGAFVSAWSKAP